MIHPSMKLLRLPNVWDYKTSLLKRSSVTVRAYLLAEQDQTGSLVVFRGVMEKPTLSLAATASPANADSPC